MNKKILSLAVVLLWGATMMYAQKAEVRTVSKYYRNALVNIMVYHPEDEFGYEIYEIFQNLPPQERYDNHDIGFRVFDNSKITGVKGRKSEGLHRLKYGGKIHLSEDEKLANAEAMHQLIEQSEMAKRIVAKWFNLTGDSLQNAHFGTELLEERSEYNASMLDVEKARYTVDGMEALKDVGEELISHSFIIVSDMTYITAENRADATKATFGVIGAVFDGLTGGNSGKRLAENVGDISDKFTGFKVITKTYLYQLEWNDSIANIFYTKYYTSTPNPEKLRAFMEDRTTFRMKFLGEESAFTEKTKVADKYDRHDILEMVTARSIDMNIAELQYKYEAFRVKVPIIRLEYDAKGKFLGYRIPIGLKENIKEDSWFEVLSKKVNKEGKVETTHYSTLKPIKNHIWDNRFNAIMEHDNDENQYGTLFKKVPGEVGSDIQPGMVVRQVDDNLFNNSLQRTKNKNANKRNKK